MKPIVINSGTRFGSLTVKERAPNTPGGQVRYRCNCDCGAETVSYSSNLRSGKALGCRLCSRRRVPNSTWEKHGHFGTKTHNTWAQMIQRCTNPRHFAYANYGGRGITVCERWRSFENFLADMGEHPDGLSIDRIDNDKGYELANCRWATALQQRHNRRDSRIEVA